MAQHDPRADADFEPGLLSREPERNVIVNASVFPATLPVGLADEPRVRHLLQRRRPQQREPEVCRVRLYDVVDNEVVPADLGNPLALFAEHCE